MKCPHCKETIATVSSRTEQKADKIDLDHKEYYITPEGKKVVIIETVKLYKSFESAGKASKRAVKKALKETEVE